MENPINKILLTDRKLRQLYIFYIGAGIVFIIILSACLLVGEYAATMAETTDNIMKLRTDLIKVKEATVDMKQTIEKINAIIPQGFFTDPPDKFILTSLDTLKALFRNSEIIISEMTAREGETVLPVTIKGPVGDYTIFVNNVGKLQSMRFPFFSIQNLSIKKVEVSVSPRKGEQVEKQFVSFEISGEVRLPKGAATPETPAEQPAPPVRRILTR